MFIRPALSPSCASTCRSHIGSIKCLYTFLIRLCRFDDDRAESGSSLVCDARPLWSDRSDLMASGRLKVPELRLGPPEGGSHLLVPPSPTAPRRRHSWICRWVNPQTVTIRLLLYTGLLPIPITTHLSPYTYYCITLLVVLLSQQKIFAVSSTWVECYHQSRVSQGSYLTYDL